MKNEEETPKKPENKRETVSASDQHINLFSFESSVKTKKDNIQSVSTERIEDAVTTEVFNNEFSNHTESHNYYTCCERDSCDEDVVVLSRCPKELNSSFLSMPTNDRKEVVDLTLHSPTQSLEECQGHPNIFSENNEKFAVVPDDDTSCNPIFTQIIYTCCVDDSCKKEDIVVLDGCPNEQQSGYTPELSPVTEEKEYKIKDLTNYLGMKDGVRSSSITDEPKLVKKFSRSLKIKKQKDV